MSNRPSSKDHLRQPQIDPFGTHAEVLELLLLALKPKSSLEFGPGLYSTALFAAHSAKHVAIEQQSPAYIDTMQRYFEADVKSGKIKLVLAESATGGHEYLDGQRYDLVMVDGHADGRAVAVNAAFAASDTIIAHDTQDARYRWEDVRMPDGWRRFDFRVLHPWTSVWTRNEKVIEIMERNK